MFGSEGKKSKMEVDEPSNLYKFDFCWMTKYSNTTLLIDNFDSFTWNVYQSLCKLGANVVVHRNTIDITLATALNPTHLVISPGPGHPSNAGVSNALIKHYAGKIPILGVCLGEQCMYEIYGGTVNSCGELIHGKTTPVKHSGIGLFEGVDQDIECTRYHSLSGDPKSLPSVLKVTAWTESGIIMGIRHEKYVMEGVQFHPESIASEQGDQMFANFLSWDGGEWSKLSKHPERIIKSSFKTLKDVDIFAGIPLDKASKMNSTHQPIPVVGNSAPESILQRIYKQRRKDVEAEKLKPGKSMLHLERSFSLHLAPSLISFKDRLQQSIDKHAVAILAEIKRASPSKGDIDLSVHPAQQAFHYHEGGASTISVLTEPNWFKGSLDDLKEVRKSLEGVKDRPAVLRKEFIFDQYQILEARLAGADTILLILSMLSDDAVKPLIKYSRELGMEPLVEVATPDEMERAIKLGSTIIGVNNRDLNTFDVDMNRTARLASLTQKSGDSIILLGLSGMTCRKDVEDCLKAGAKGALIGEALMKSKNQISMIQSLLGNSPLNAVIDEKPKPLVKICGITNANDALHAIKSGADLIGLIFVKSSPRYVTPEKGLEIAEEIRKHYPVNAVSEVSHPISISPESSISWYGRQTFESKKPLIVGVFQKQSAQEINDIVKKCHIDIIQCHSPQSQAFHRLLSKPIIQVIGLKEKAKANQSVSVVADHVVKECNDYSGTASFILLDTCTVNQSGGTSKVFDWDILNEIAKSNLKVGLAGGLNPENVQNATNFNPLFIDVSSGVERQPGLKDHEKVERFIKLCHQTMGLRSPKRVKK
ncbi:indole-3-glycerol phosphate synthase-domain-containing protein [Globomyces pollinis-pini]|nr:indole-3-glycerol phosphate synthase-domain-containing protein [Globomyces pollinis-pini]